MRPPITYQEVVKAPNPKLINEWCNSPCCNNIAHVVYSRGHSPVQKPFRSLPLQASVCQADDFGKPPPYKSHMKVVESLFWWLRSPSFSGFRRMQQHAAAMLLRRLAGSLYSLRRHSQNGIWLHAAIRAARKFSVPYKPPKVCCTFPCKHPTKWDS